MDKTSEVTTLLREAEERLVRARQLLSVGGDEDVPSVSVGGLILAEVLEEGGFVERERLHEIARLHGMDIRGLGGFFTGRGSLQMVPETDRVMLTPEGVKTARRYLRKSGKPYVSEPNLARAAEPSFAKDWDNDVDAAYDNL